VHNAVGTPYCKVQGTSHPHHSSHLAVQSDNNIRAAWCPQFCGGCLFVRYSFACICGLIKDLYRVELQDQRKPAQVTRAWAVAAPWCCARVLLLAKLSLVLLVHTRRVRPLTANGCQSAAADRSAVLLQVSGMVVGRRACLPYHGVQAARWLHLASAVGAGKQIACILGSKKLDVGWLMSCTLV
jgi:hypothetical protein